MKAALREVLEKVAGLEILALDCEAAREKLAGILAREILQRKELRKRVYELEKELRQYRTLDEGHRERNKPQKHR